MRPSFLECGSLAAAFAVAAPSQKARVIIRWNRPTPRTKARVIPNPRILRAKDFNVFSFSFLRSRASALGIASSY
jgi:hypothetical protein